jgi:hypothetical protein
MIILNAEINAVNLPFVPHLIEISPTKRRIFLIPVDAILNQVKVANRDLFHQSVFNAFDD